MRMCMHSQVRAEARLEALPPSERATRGELELTDFVKEKEHMADPSLVFDGLVGLQAKPPRALTAAFKRRVTATCNRHVRPPRRPVQLPRATATCNRHV